jgi:hypothetical protein
MHDEHALQLSINDNSFLKVIEIWVIIYLMYAPFISRII